MKPHLLKVPLRPESSIAISKIDNFYNQWHFHPEIELIYIHKGRGTRFIGNDVHRFKQDELCLIGSNLPHMWRSDPEHFTEEYSLDVTVIYFHHDFLGDKFFNIPEVKNIDSLLEKAKRGIKITGNTALQIKDMITRLSDVPGLTKIITLLEILEKIAFSVEREYINTIYIPQIEKSDADRLNSVFQFISNNFKRKISLTEIASVANLSAKAFCRYFKSKTHKTFNNFLLEVKVAHACNIILEKDVTIYEVCYESGFNNLSNFNRSFKKLMNKTPLEFKREHRVLTE